ncbi:MAG: hypothetical protein LBF92_06535 [Synergistaceae bacterium]|jgi:hypothetical protein|nr:hypothetical protein [Synergistaceae bacterium]
MPGGANAIARRRLAVRALLIAALVAIAFWMHSIGKEHNVLFDNRAAVIDGVEYAPAGTLALSIDGAKKNDVRADARVAHKMTGSSHRVRVGAAGSDKGVERAIRLDRDMKKWMISLPALLSGAPDIYVPVPVAAPPPPPPGDEPAAPAAEGLGADAPDMDGASVETIPGTGL